MRQFDCNRLAKVAYHADRCPVQYSIRPVDDSKKALGQLYPFHNLSLNYLATVPFLKQLENCHFWLKFPIGPWWHHKTWKKTVIRSLFPKCQRNCHPRLNRKEMGRYLQPKNGSLDKMAYLDRNSRLVKNTKNLKISRDFLKFFSSKVPPCPI